MVLIKKYSNRRLYDTDESRYITLDELSAKIERGTDVRVVDAKSGQDLTQLTLTQILFESRGAAQLLPTPLLVQMIRMGELPFAEFMGRWVSWAFEVYMQARRGFGLLSHINPFGSLPIPMPLRNMAAAGRRSEPRSSAPEGPDEGDGVDEANGADEPEDTPPARKPPKGAREEVADLRREMEELKQILLQRMKE